MRVRSKSTPALMKKTNAEYFSELFAEDDYDYSSSDSASWVDEFFAKVKNPWICRVPDEFIMDNFNLYGLSKMVPNYELCISIIRDFTRISDVELPENKLQALNSYVQSLYFLIHARYVQTNNGLMCIYEKFKKGEFGVCPRSECKGQKVVPVGVSSKIGISECLVYCPRCKDIFHAYNKKSSAIDGAAFGPTFGPFFFNIFPRLVPHESAKMLPMSIFGFKVNEKKIRSVRKPQ